jgi:hypothetical protein
MDEYCLVCAARGHLVEAVCPVKCHMTGAHPPQCPVCKEPTALVSQKQAEDTVLTFANSSGIVSLWTRRGYLND